MGQYVATRVFRLGADVFGVSKQPSIITKVDDWLEFQKRKRLDSEDYALRWAAAWKCAAERIR